LKATLRVLAPNKRSGTENTITLTVYVPVSKRADDSETRRSKSISVPEFTWRNQYEDAKTLSAHSESGDEISYTTNPINETSLSSK
jgi:hypothetical protein